MNAQPILFVQGAGSMQAPDGSGRLAAYLASALGAGYRVIAPQMPDADKPRYQPWRDRLEAEFDALEDELIVVGHSFGGSVLLKYFAEGSLHKPVRALFLVSVPNWGPDGWAYDEFAVPNDVGARLPTSAVFLYHSHEDAEVPFEHLHFYEKLLPGATARAISGSEHSFTKGLPALVDDIRSLA